MFEHHPLNVYVFNFQISFGINEIFLIFFQKKEGCPCKHPSSKEIL